MGALAWHTGGVFVDERWLRLLGGVSVEGLPDLATASGMEQQPPPFMVVAFDVLGGRFAVNGGGLPGEPGEVAYFGPETLSWEPLGQPYSGFVAWALTGDLARFYSDLRWSGLGSRSASGSGLVTALVIPAVVHGPGSPEPRRTVASLRAMARGHRLARAHGPAAQHPA